MKLFVTGPLGHIGSAFIHHIQPGEYEQVVLLDNLSTQRYCSLFNLPRGVPFRFIEGDICEVDLGLLFQGMDVVLHLAAITDAANSHAIANEVMLVNAWGTERVAQACAEAGCRLVFPSSTSVYGTQDALVDESTPTGLFRPQSPYAYSKLLAERLLKRLGEYDNLKYIIVRFGTIFGTSIGMRFHTAVNRFCWQACAGVPISVWRTAVNQKRPYLALSDAVRALDFIIKGNRFDGETYNVLTENATVGQIVDAIKALIPDTRVEFVDSPVMNQLSYEVACEKFKALGFEFKGSIRDGIAETINLIRWMRQYDPARLSMDSGGNSETSIVFPSD